MGADPALASPLDFFETPPEAFLPLLPYLRKPRMWVDLGCGRGALGRMLADRFGVKGFGVEFLPERADQAMETGAYLHVVRGDIGDRETVYTLKRLIFEATSMKAPTPEMGLLVISNPPFQQWELFEEVAQELIWTRHLEDEIALLLPAMAFEKRKTSAIHYKKRALAIRRANGRYDLASRPAFLRKFVDANGKAYIAQKGEAPSAYAWLVSGENHTGSWKWLESEPPK